MLINKKIRFPKKRKKKRKKKNVSPKPFSTCGQAETFALPFSATSGRCRKRFLALSQKRRWVFRKSRWRRRSRRPTHSGRRRATGTPNRRWRRTRTRTSRRAPDEGGPSGSRRCPGWLSRRGWRGRGNQCRPRVWCGCARRIQLICTPSRGGEWGPRPPWSTGQGQWRPPAVLRQRRRPSLGSDAGGGGRPSSPLFSKKWTCKPRSPVRTPPSFGSTASIFCQWDHCR